MDFLSSIEANLRRSKVGLKGSPENPGREPVSYKKVSRYVKVS